LAKNPKLLLGDEPTGNLDSKTSAQVMTVLAEACRTLGVTAIIVTHDPALTKYATRVIRIDSGRLVSDESVVNKAASAVGSVIEKVGQMISGSDE
jgi:putative ABC transport system ATP-binding protein